ncbi:SDR family NAD(P)-dependent oxidoreductase [Rhodococcus sp. CX]|uniref:SDR family NAD(P)-dependent oxidoreductase n=1 Tax=Rhodococcus sp. CX TaxID=2789880 RepID=UPI001E3EA046|nr:SDR family NAD(P)-dependent oxidoreductase [Rhodococcus sp. CX]
MSGHFVVTGGRRGIGAAIVRAAARAGHEVGFTYHRDTDAATCLVAECGLRVRAIETDVADTGAAETGVDTAVQSGGEVAVLVNNAGITGPLGDFLTVTAAQVRDIVGVNVFGVVGDDRGCGSLPARARTTRCGDHHRQHRRSHRGCPASTGDTPHPSAAVEAITRGRGHELAPGHSCRRHGTRHRRHGNSRCCRRSGTASTGYGPHTPRWCRCHQRDRRRGWVRGR